MDIKTGIRLQELRKSYGYSQDALAEKLGISRQAVSKWERGESSPDTDKLIALANLYEITLDEVLNSDTINNGKKVVEMPVAKVHVPGIYEKTAKSMFKFPFPILVIAVYLIFSFIFHCWHPLWLIFITLPIYYQFAAACTTKTKKGFLFTLPVPEVVVGLYLTIGLLAHLWLPTAVLFLIIPAYYWSVAMYKKKSHKSE